MYIYIRYIRYIIYIAKASYSGFLVYNNELSANAPKVKK